jgi:hypothetical protein
MEKALLILGVIALLSSAVYLHSQDSIAGDIDLLNMFNNWKLTYNIKYETAVDFT